MTILLTVLAGAALGGVVTGISVWIGLWYRGRRTAAFAVEASRLGLRVVRSGLPRAISPEPRRAGFRLLDHERAATANALFGTVGDIAMSAFDFSFKTGLGQDRSHDQTCALAVLPAKGPSVAIERETAATRALGIVGLRDVQVGDPEFDREFRVRSDDPAGVAGFLGQGLRRWLIDAAPHDLSFEVRGWTLLVCGRRRRPRDIESFLGLVRSFAQLVRPALTTAAQGAAAAEARANTLDVVSAREPSTRLQVRLAVWVGVVLGAALGLFGLLAQRVPL